MLARQKPGVIGPAHREQTTGKEVPEPTFAYLETKREKTGYFTAVGKYVADMNIRDPPMKMSKKRGPGAGFGFQARTCLSLVVEAPRALLPRIRLCLAQSSPPGGASS